MRVCGGGKQRQGELQIHDLNVAKKQHKLQSHRENQPAAYQRIGAVTEPNKDTEEEVWGQRGLLPGRPARADRPGR